MGKKEWFGEWFDSPYYHILYKDRDNSEAQFFIDNLARFLGFEKGQRVMDLACGKGRHSIYLNEKGLEVTGLDLSPSNVEFANNFSNETLRFFEHDMRNLFQENEFDYVLNMFTSFGYFNTDSENQRVITNASRALKQQGIFVLDFLNPYRVIHSLVKEEIVKKEGIEFHVSRHVEEGFIVKTIMFGDKAQHFAFQEKVQAIRKDAFLTYFRKAGLGVTHIFGDYGLQPYEQERSERMIFIAKK